MLVLLVDLEDGAQTYVAGVAATAEHTCVWVIADTDPGGLGHISYRVECLLPAIELITLLIERRSWLDLKMLSRVPLTTL